MIPINYTIADHEVGPGSMVQFLISRLKPGEERWLVWHFNGTYNCNANQRDNEACTHSPCHPYNAKPHICLFSPQDFGLNLSPYKTVQIVLFIWQCRNTRRKGVYLSFLDTMKLEILHMAELQRYEKILPVLEKFPNNPVIFWTPTWIICARTNYQIQVSDVPQILRYQMKPPFPDKAFPQRGDSSDL